MLCTGIWLLAQEQPNPAEPWLNLSPVDARRYAAMLQEETNLRLRFDTLQQEREAMRLRTCLDAEPPVKTAQCGQFAEDGSPRISRLPAKAETMKGKP